MNVVGEIWALLKSLSVLTGLPFQCGQNYTAYMHTDIHLVGFSAPLKTNAVTWMIWQASDKLCALG